MILLLMVGHAIATTFAPPPEPCSVGAVAIVRGWQEREALHYGDLEWLPEPNTCGMRPLSEVYDSLEAFDESLIRTWGSLDVAAAVVGLQHSTLRSPMDGYERVAGHWKDLPADDPDVPNSIRDYLRAWRWRLRHPCFHPDILRAPWGWDRQWLHWDRVEGVPLQCTMTTEPWMYPEGSRLSPVKVTWTFSAGFIDAGPAEAKPEP